MALPFDEKQFKEYLNGDLKQYFYKAAVEQAERMLVHADGIYPKCLIADRRPNEPLEVQQYRAQIWVPITKPTFQKVFSSLQKIRRSQDWMIRYTEADQFTRIADDQSLEQYMESDFPYFSSLTNWVFALMLRKYLIDANAVILVIPLNTTAPEPNEYLQPFPIIFDSWAVLDYKEGNYAVLENPLGATYTAASGATERGRSFYFVTTEQVLKYDQIDSKGTYEQVMDYAHGLNMLPCFKMPGVLLMQAVTEYMQETRVAGMLPHLDEAAREYSDLQAAKVLHIYPERWEFSQNECNECKGTRVRPNPLYDPSIVGCAHEIACEACAGAGYIVKGPYGKVVIHPVAAIEGATPVPTPPAGYIEKDTAVVSLQQTSVDEHIFKALAAINFEFLAKTPLAQSGVAKEVDRDELNNTVNSIAEDLVYAMDKCYQLCAYYRYKDLYSFDDIDGMLPTVNVPQQFDLLSAARSVEELKLAKDNKANPVVINAMEVDYATKRFSTTPEIRDLLTMVLALDPLPNITEDDKVSRLTNKGITLQTYIVSSNIQEFVARALDSVKNFTEMTLAEQKTIINAFAAEQILATSTAAMIVNTTGNGLDDVSDDGDGAGDTVGKIPLAIQQLTLAASRAAEAGNVAQVEAINKKIDSLLLKIGE